MKEYYRWLLLGFIISLLFVLGKSMISKIMNNKQKIVERPTSLFVKGNNNDVGCISIFVKKYSDATYSFDGGKTWQKSNYGAVYQNGSVDILAKNSKQEIIFTQKMDFNSIVNDAPVIKVGFDKTIKSFNNNDLLSGVEVIYKNQDVSNDLEVEVLDHDEKSVLVSYYIEKDNKRCAVLRKAYIGEESVDNSEWIWPTDSPYVISSGYGYRNGKLHRGVDIYGMKRGSFVYAARDGEVIDITSNSSSGHYVILKHDNGYYTRYAHMQNIEGNDKLKIEGSANKYIKVGQRVQAHDVIGEIGSSGNSTAVLLHYEIWNGIPWQSQSFNPLSFYKKR